MQFYHKVGNTISVNQNACLIIDLANSNASDNRFNIFGGVININQGGTLGIRGAYRVSIGDRDGGLIQVNQGGRLEITGVGEIRNIRSANKSNLGIYNNGGEMILKLDRGIYNTSYDAGTSSFYAGSIVQTSGSTLIAHNDENQDTLVYNSGFTTFGGATYGARHSLIEVQGGNFEVKGNIKNGGDSSGAGGAGVGWIVGRGNATISVRGWIRNTSEDNTLPSKIDLDNATLNVGSLENKQNGEIWLKDQASINATTSITSEANSKMYFIGHNDGFGKLTANSLDLKGEEIFRVDTLKATQDLKYLVATSPSTQGFNTGTITIQDISGFVSDRYTAELTQEGENTYIQLTPKNGYVPPTPPTNPPTPPTTPPTTTPPTTTPPTPSTPPSSSPSPQSPSANNGYISNPHSIQTELTKQYLILTNSTLEQTTQTILSQIEQIQSLKSINTYALSNLYNRSIQTQIKKPKPLLAYNYPILYPMSYTQGDYLPPPLFEGEKKLSVFANLIGGVFGYDSHLGGNYGINAGADYLLGDNLFLGGYGVLLGKSLQQEGLQMQGFEVELGGYGRYLLAEWEFDTTLSYSLLNTHTQRSFTLYSQTFSQDASFNTHFFNIEERVGYRFNLSDFDTLKPFGGVAMHIYSQPSYEESGNFAYIQSDIFYGALGLLAGVEYRKIFRSSSFYLGASFLYQLPIFGDTTYSLQYLDSLLYFENSQDFIAQIQAGLDLSLTKNSFLSLELNYHHSLSKYFNVDMMIGYRHLF